MTGGATPTPSSPLTWYVAYAGVMDTTKWATTNSVMVAAADHQSGIVGYGVNQSSTVAPTYTNITKRTYIQAIVNGLTSNGTYYMWLKDERGNVSVTPFTVSYVDRDGPSVTNKFAGSMLYVDPTFASGTNGINIYNNYGNGNVLISRVALSGAPEGSGYGLEIKSIGDTTPGTGGFYFGNPTSANKTYITRIVAKIPVGLTIEWASNAIGTGGWADFLTGKAGTGDWKEYICLVNTGSSGTFSSTNFFFLLGNSVAPTPSSPITWYVAYATVFDTTATSTYNYITFTGTDSAGITGYGLNQSSTTQPSFTNVSQRPIIGGVTSAVSTKGTYYLWLRDALGNISNSPVTVNYTTN